MNTKAQAPKLVPLSLRVPPELRRSLKILSAKEGMTMSGLAESILAKGVQDRLKA